MVVLDSTMSKKRGDPQNKRRQINVEIYLKGKEGEGLEFPPYGLATAN